MNTRAQLAELRRQQLLAECRVQRADLAAQLEPVGHSLQALEAGMSILKRVRRHPGWIASAAVGLMLITPRRLSALTRGGTAGLRTWRSIAPLLERLRGG